jgi:response regulator RpfG family c-di-GMP phosphodiesterase
MSAKVLMVDDDPIVLSAFQRVLHKEDYEFKTTTSPEDALSLLKNDLYAVVISDQHMPAMEGSLLLEKLREISPSTVRIMITGDAHIDAAIEAINKGEVYRFLRKPWDNDDIRMTLKQAIQQFDLVAENKRLQELTKSQNAELKELNQNLEAKVQERTGEVLGLHQKLQASFRETVQALAGIADLHSRIIGNHTKRVGAMSLELGKRMNLSETDLFDLEFAGMLHDVGKVAVPADILKKALSSLTTYERGILETHAVKGEAVLRVIPHFAKVSKLVRHHHERYDGTGFPDRLKGTQIPLGSRIISVVNVFDKFLNGQKVYESATPEKALAQIESRCPAEFDPEVVSALAKYVRQGEGKWWTWGEIEMGLRDLQVGMMLSRDLKTASGILLLPKDHEIQEKDLQRMLNFQDTDPIIDDIYVYRNANT